jgi:heptaprenylglyceryl phosphate synthase
MILFVGGGIRDGESARRAIQAGADWIVTGNLTESFENSAALETTLKSLINTMRS